MYEYSNKNLDNQIYYLTINFLLKRLILIVRLKLLGRRQAVRHRFLESTFAGSNPAAPAILIK